MAQGNEPELVTGPLRPPRSNGRSTYYTQSLLAVDYCMGAKEQSCTGNGG